MPTSMEIFHYSFMIRAFVAGLCIGVVAPLLGTFIVAKRYALIADSLAHVSLAGVALGLLLGFNPLLAALGVVVVVAMLIEHLRSTGRLSGEVALAMFLSSGLAIAVVLMSLAGSTNINLFAYLFGSIATVTQSDLYVIVPLAAAITLLVVVLYKEMAYLAFDDEAAQVSGLPTRVLNQMLIILTAVMVVLSLRIVGGLLIGALTVIPVAAAMQVARNFKQTVWLAVLFGLAAVIGGLFAAFYFNIPAGGAIVLAALTEFLVALLFKRLRHN